VRPSGVATAMTGGLDTESENVDKQSIEVWTEVVGFTICCLSAAPVKDVKQPSSDDEVQGSWQSCGFCYQPFL
jgi:hypothetical protein